MVIFLPQTIAWIRPSSVDSQVCKNSLNKSVHGTIYWTTNNPPKPTCSTHCRTLAPIRIYCSILVISFPPTSAHFWVTLASETPSSTGSFPLHLIIHLNCALIGTTTGMSGELVSMSKYCSSIGSNERSVDCSTSTSCLVPFSMAPFFHLFSCLKIANDYDYMF